MDIADDEDLNKELSLFEMKRGRSQSLSAVPQDGETRSAFFPPGQSGDDRHKFAEVNNKVNMGEIYMRKLRLHYLVFKME